MKLLSQSVKEQVGRASLNPVKDVVIVIAAEDMHLTASVDFREEM